MASQQPAEGEIVGSCDIGTLARLKEDHKDGFFLVVSQKGCGDCTEMKSVLNEVVKDSKPIVDADISEDESCLTLAEQLNVGLTPTVFYFKDGEEKLRMDGQTPNADGTPITWDQVRGKVRELIAAPPSPAPQPSPSP